MRRNLAPGCISSDVKLCQRKPLSLFFGDPFFWDPLFSVFLFFLSPAKGLKCNLEPNCLQPHACAQRFRLRILRRTRSNAGRTSASSLSGRIESIWETPSKERAPIFVTAPFLVQKALKRPTPKSLFFVSDVKCAT